MFVVPMLLATTGLCQAPFDRTGQVFLSLQNSNEVVKMIVNPSSFVPQFNATYPLPNVVLDAIGFRKTDNLIYGISPNNNHLFTVGADGVSQDLGAPPLHNSLHYLAGDVSPDGKELVSIGSSAAHTDVHLAKTNLENGSLSTVFVQMGGNSFMADIAFDPYSGQLYGYDQANRNMVKINSASGAVTVMHQLDAAHEIVGLYFDSFGDLHGYGRAVNNIVEAVFDIDKNTGIETVIATGPLNSPSDAASCPFSIEIRAAFEPKKTLPCTDALLNYTIANGSGEPRPGVSFVHDLPTGMNLCLVYANPFGTPVDTTSVPGRLRMDGLNLPPGIKLLSFKIKVNDIPKGIYKSQPYLENLPQNYGLVSIADNPATAGFEDSTILKVNRFDEDSLFNQWLVCLGQTLILDASEYGTSFVWNDGSTNSHYEVTQSGIYTLDIGTTCEELIVRHDVTATSCPFTVALYQVFEPDSIFGCNNTVFSFILKNDSGEKREQVELTETMPVGFSLEGIVRNPFGGSLKAGLTPNVIAIENMTMPIGTDTIDLLVHVGDVPPGKYRFRGMLSGLPQLMGPTRYSDDPFTFSIDSSTLQVLGTLEDTLALDTIICLKQKLVLDASSFGTSFLWEDGSTEHRFVVEQPGIYHVTLFDGCEPVELYWDVAPANSITVTSVSTLNIHQGAEIVLKPLIQNQEDSLLISWRDPLGNSLSCLDCPKPVAMPLQNTAYSVVVSNTTCADSTTIELLVDATRRVYAPNVFSPNGDGINDYFFLQSPDFSKIHSLQITGRWGNRVFNSVESMLNVPISGWDGLVNGKEAQPGSYLWQAEIEFIDGKKQAISGEVSLFR